MRYGITRVIIINSPPFGNEVKQTVYSEVCFNKEGARRREKRLIRLQQYYKQNGPRREEKRGYRGGGKEES